MDIATNKVIGTSEMAVLLGVTSQTLVRLAGEPTCPALRVGRVLRWPVNETLAWLRGRQRDHVCGQPTTTNP